MAGLGLRLAERASALGIPVVMIPDHQVAATIIDAKGWLRLAKPFTAKNRGRHSPRYVYERALRDAGYQTLGFSDYFVAASDLDQGVGRLLIVDIKLTPRTPNGLAIARMARQRRPGLPIIFVTGHPEIASLIDTKLGPILLKPVQLDELLATVQARLQSIY